MNPATAASVAVVVFDGFELLDVFGPLELFGLLPNRYRMTLVGPAQGPVRSAQGVQAMADCAYRDAPPCTVLLVPGGVGTRQLVRDAALLDWLREYAAQAAYITSVCTGSGVLAAAGLLDGYRATSNKQAFAWPQSQGPKVEWVPVARWVVDGNRWTSAGVSAGMDMALALIAKMQGEDIATRVADEAEYDWHRDATWDPFAAKNGLTS